MGNAPAFSIRAAFPKLPVTARFSLLAIDLGRGLVVERLVEAAVVVKLKVFSQPVLGLPDGAVFV